MKNFPDEVDGALEGGAWFGVMKLKFGLVKLRYRGLKKNANHLFAVCALVNLYLVLKKLLLLTPA